jgi:hypothetical protein
LSILILWDLKKRLNILPQFCNFLKKMKTYIKYYEPFKKIITMTNDFNKRDEIRKFLEYFNTGYKEITGFVVELNVNSG